MKSNPKHLRRIRRKIERAGLDWARTDFLVNPQNWHPLPVGVQKDRLLRLIKTLKLTEA